jgi:hypothetical protein
MASAGIIGGWRDRPDITMAGLGLVSGVLSATVGYDLEIAWLKPVAPLFFLDVGPMPIGFFFGAAVAFGIWWWTRNPWSVPALLVTTMYAWSAAIQIAIRLQRNVDDDPHLIAASLAAGAVGAGLTHAGCALFSRGLRQPMRIAVTCGVGALFGLLFFFGQRKFIDERLLFVVWQPVVAFCIGMALAERNREA